MGRTNFREGERGTGAVGGATTITRATVSGAEQRPQLPRREYEKRRLEGGGVMQGLQKHS